MVVRKFSCNLFSRELSNFTTHVVPGRLSVLVDYIFVPCGDAVVFSLDKLLLEKFALYPI